MLLTGSPPKKKHMHEPFIDSVQSPASRASQHVKLKRVIMLWFALHFRNVWICLQCYATVAAIMSRSTVFKWKKTYHMNLGKPYLSLESDHLWNQFLRRHVQSLSGKRLSMHQVSLSALSCESNHDGCLQILLNIEVSCKCSLKPILYHLVI